MFNKVILVGNLTRDPELRYLPNGSAVCNTAIATNRRYKTQSGEQKEEVCFIDITLFSRTAEIASQYLRKGSKILIEGRLKLEQWTDQNGNKRSKHTVTVETMQMLDSKSQDDDSAYHQNSNTHSYENTPEQNIPKHGSSPHEHDINDDEIPF